MHPLSPHYVGNHSEGTGQVFPQSPFFLHFVVVASLLAVLIEQWVSLLLFRHSLSNGTSEILGLELPTVGSEVYVTAAATTDGCHSSGDWKCYQ